MTSEQEGDLGHLLREHRTARKLSVRGAARRAGFSEGRWRQLESGFERRHGTKIPVNPKPITVVQAADAVGLDAEVALKAAGISGTIPNIQRANEIRATIDALTYLSKQPESIASHQNIRDVINTARTVIERTPENHKTSPLIRQLESQLSSVRTKFAIGQSAHETDVHFREAAAEGSAFLNLAAHGSGKASAAPAAAAGQGTAGGPDESLDLRGRLRGLDLDALKRLRDMVDGAIFVAEHPNVDEEIAAAAVAFAEAEVRYFQVTEPEEAAHAVYEEMRQNPSNFSPKEAEDVLKKWNIAKDERREAERALMGARTMYNVLRQRRQKADLYLGKEDARAEHREAPER
ncbi:helix-turn-helix transcriptional regulator [Amycolatopsis sp. FDAARGOS 1241]|uniref:helix-turn-helix domain-containing protein n=1 Tax=Amycolatopsis sp. FDAARGOS 1241 TaxID=2778070 RepID=UPI0019522E74|nr:helix-turn-helix transcriptional regulator [Amycolatopsis sp. FDAARGOS 1241]QRP47980.1 helix-turn-helix domain-containing protein [Amycolatopsis sp. FDAARGOS 1241]